MPLGLEDAFDQLATFSPGEDHTGHFGSFLFLSQVFLCTIHSVQMD